MPRDVPRSNYDSCPRPRLSLSPDGDLLMTNQVIFHVKYFDCTPKGVFSHA